MKYYLEKYDNKSIIITYYYTYFHTVRDSDVVQEVLCNRIFLLQYTSTVQNKHTNNFICPTFFYSRFAYYY